MSRIIWDDAARQREAKAKYEKLRARKRVNRKKWKTVIIPEGKRSARGI